MTVLLNCSTELLLEIFKYIDNIDVVLRLAYGCRRLYQIFNYHRQEIIKHVILHSKTHRYDLMLCRFNDAFHEFITPHLHHRHGTIAPGLHPPHIRFEDCLNNHQSEKLNDHIWDVFARWKGLKVFQHLYTNSTVHTIYTMRPCVPAGVRLTQHPILDILTIFRSDAGNSIGFGDAESERFHTALTKYWLVMECTRFAQICRYDFQSNENKVSQQVDALWYQYADFQESLDTLEVYDFVYGFLNQNVQYSNADTWRQWRYEEDQWEYDRHSGGDEEIWGLFMKLLPLSLSPADVLELLVLSSRWKQEPSSEWDQEKKTQYLRTRVMFDNFFPEQSPMADAEENSFYWHSVEDLEDACRKKLNCNGGPLPPRIQIPKKMESHQGFLEWVKVEGESEVNRIHN